MLRDKLHLKIVTYFLERRAVEEYRILVCLLRSLPGYRCTKEIKVAASSFNTSKELSKYPIVGRRLLDAANKKSYVFLFLLLSFFLK